MATTIITKNGSGAPATGDLVQGELAVDLTNKTLYSKDSSGNVFKVGDTGGGSPGTFTDLVATDSFTSPGIDDNATSTAITIDASENVGIGTSRPSTSLDIVRAGVEPLRIQSTTSGTVQMRLSNTAGNAFINGVGSNIVIPSGRVGIGQSENLTDTLTIGRSTYAPNQTERMRVVLGDTTGSHLSAGFGIKTNSSGTSRLSIETASGTAGEMLEVITANSSGKVAVGTSNPDAFGLFEVQANATNGQSGSGLLTLRNTVSNGCSMSFYTPTNDWSWGTNSVADMSLYNIDSAVTPFLVAKDAPSSALRLTGAGPLLKGKVEIGTGVVDSEVLNLRGFYDDRGLNVKVLTEDLKTDALVNFNNERSDGRFSWSLDGSEKMRIDDSGFVGIGTTTPAALLDVSGLSPAIKVNALNNDIPRLELARDASTTNWRFVNDASILRTQVGDDSTSWGETYRVTSGKNHYWNDDQMSLVAGNFGVGTSNPAANFHVKAPDTAGGDIAYFDDSGSGATGRLQIMSTGGTGVDFMRIGSVNRSLQLGTASNGVVTIKTGTLNVGIGTENPQEKLTVWGPVLSNNALYSPNQEQAYMIASTRSYGGSTPSWGTYGYQHKLKSNNVGSSRITVDTINGEVYSMDEYGLAKFTNRVGIGTDSPHTTSSLDVVNNRSFQLRVGNSTTNPGKIALASADTVGGVFIGGDNEDLVFETNGQNEKMRIDSAGNVLVGRTSVSAAATDYGWQAYNTGIVYQYANAATSTDVHRWYNGAGTLVASINARGEGFFLGGATYSGPLKADEIIQDGAPVVDSLQIIRAFMKLRAATADPDSTVEELREKLKTAVDDIIDQFQDQIDNMPTPLED